MVVRNEVPSSDLYPSFHFFKDSRKKKEKKDRKRDERDKDRKVRRSVSREMMSNLSLDVGLDFVCLASSNLTNYYGFFAKSPKYEFKTACCFNVYYC